MQTRHPFFDELAKLSTGAMGLAQAAGEEAKTAWRTQADRFVADMDLVRHDDLESMKAEIAALRAELAALKSGAAAPDKPVTGTRKRGTPPKDAAG